MIIFLNDKQIGHLDGSSLAAAKRWVKRYVTSTHMGEWRQLPDGFEYATTIGQYYQFRKDPA